MFNILIMKTNNKLYFYFFENLIIIPLAHWRFFYFYLYDLKYNNPVVCILQAH